MKILHICTGWPLSYQGGITNYVRELAQEQYRNGNDVYVLGAPDKEKYDFKYVPYTSKIVAFSYRPLIDKEALKIIEKFLSTEKFDIIHIHAIEYIDWDLYKILSSYHYVVSLHDYCFICPRIYMYQPSDHVCDMYVEHKCKKCISFFDRYYSIRILFERLSKKANKHIRVPYFPQNITQIRYEKFRRLLNNADFLLPVSNKVQEIYQNSGIYSKSKVLHIGNISADYFTSEFKYNMAPHRIKIVFLGRLSKYKGADLFIEIANQLKGCKNIEFHFLGNSSEYKGMLPKVGIIDHGKYNQEDLPKLLQEYDLGMVLSIWHDNGPQVVMELLNNHIPVIGTRMGGIPDFIEEGVNGFLFDPYSKSDVDRLCNRLKTITVNDIYAMKKSIKHTTTSHEHYSQLMEVYRNVICSANDANYE